MKFRTILVAALATGLAVPALAAPAPTPPAADPAKQALAVRVAASLWPDGTYGRLVETMFVGKDGLTDMVFDMRPADLMVTMAQAFAEDGKPAAKPKGPAEPPSPTIREMMIAKDPHFEERTRITMKVVGEEVRRIATPIEPKFREGLAKSIARRFTSEQLGPIATFLETEPGRAYAAQSMTLFIDKDVMLALVHSVPAMVKEMPAAMEKVEKATAHLPKPPKDKPAEPVPDDDKADEDDNDAGE